jgi:hypothetical protein
MPDKPTVKASGRSDFHVAGEKLTASSARFAADPLGVAPRRLQSWRLMYINASEAPAHAFSYSKFH